MSEHPPHAPGVDDERSDDERRPDKQQPDKEQPDNESSAEVRTPFAPHEDDDSAFGDSDQHSTA